MKYSPENERIKRQYLNFLQEAKRQNTASVDAAAAALNRFEEYTSYRDFKRFHTDQAVAFKNHLANQRKGDSANKLSKATLHSTLGHLKRFFQWLACQPGYKSRIAYSDADYFNLSEKDGRIARYSRPGGGPTLEQIKSVIAKMPTNTDIELRNQAVVAFTILTGARDKAIASLKLKHIDLENSCVFQDANEVQTKFSKSFPTYFFPIGEDIKQIVIGWISHLREKLLWGDNDPLFPKTSVAVGQDQLFTANGLLREHWSNASPIRKIFREAFIAADLPYFIPHSFRKTLVGLAEKHCTTPERFKAWSQNLGHEDVMTTFTSYGEVSEKRQAEIIKSLSFNERDKAQEIKRLINELSQLY